MGEFKYTTKERQTIDAAYAACKWMADDAGYNLKSRLESAMRYERKQRSSVTVAKALVVREFCVGLYSNPKASEVAFMSEGCATAVLVGAACRRVAPSRRAQYGVETKAAAAREAHDTYLHRGVATACNVTK